MTLLVVFTGLALIGGCVLFLATRHPGLGLPLMVGAFLRTVVGFIGIHAVPFRLPYSGDDAVGFERSAWAMATSGWKAILDGFNPTSGFDYIAPFATVYALVGRVPQALMFYNVFLGVLTVWMVYLVGKSLGDRRVAVWAAWAIAIFPASILMSSLVLRESGVAFGVAVGALGVVQTMRHQKIGFLLLAVAGLGFATLLHGGLLVPSIGILAGLAILQSRSSLGRGRIHVPTLAAALVAIILMAGAAAFVGAGNLRLASVGVINFETAESRVLATSERIAAGGSSYYGGTTTESWGQAVVQLPGRTTLFMFSPLPWTVRSATQVIGLMDGLIWMLMVMALVKHRRRIWDDPASRLLLIFVILGLMVYALGTTNAGTALRHRTKVIPVLLPLVIFAMHRAGQSIEPTPATPRAKATHMTNKDRSPASATE